MDKLTKTIKELEIRLNNLHAIRLELKKLSLENQELIEILEIINTMDEKKKTILKRMCIDGDSPEDLYKELGLKPRQIYYLKKDALKTLLARIN